MASKTGTLSWEALAGRVNLFAVHAALYRLLGGRLVGKDVLILTTMGRKSGQPRSTPLFYVRDGGDYVIVASNGGDESYPGWWHNIRSNPHVSIQVGPRRLPCRAEKVRTEDAEELWPKLMAVYGGYARYREQTKRPLTMFRLRPAASDPALPANCRAVRTRR